MTPEFWIQLSIQLVDDFLDGHGRLQRSQREEPFDRLTLGSPRRTLICPLLPDLLLFKLLLLLLLLLRKTTVDPPVGEPEEEDEDEVEEKEFRRRGIRPLPAG